MKKLLLFLSFIICCALCIKANAQEGEDRGYIVKVGDMAPDFELTMDNGKTIRLSQLRGKVVMLQFTASWCGICRKEMPFIESDIWQKYKNDNDFVLVGIDREETADKVALLREFDKLIRVSKCQAKSRRYPVIKKWFLDKFPEIAEFGITAEAIENEEATAIEEAIEDEEVIETEETMDIAEAPAVRKAA
jgi:thiol-disulfide isomerase/thioredoxin